MERVETYIAYQGGVGITSEQTEIHAESPTAAKRKAGRMFNTPGRWSRCTFEDKFEKVERHGWSKGASGWAYGDNYIHLYVKETE